MVWKFLYILALNKINKLGYKKIDIGDNNKYMKAKFVKRVSYFADDVVVVFIKGSYLCMKKNRNIYKGGKRTKIHFKSDISFNSDEAVWFGIILKNIRSKIGGDNIG